MALTQNELLASGYILGIHDAGEIESWIEDGELVYAYGDSRQSSDADVTPVLYPTLESCRAARYLCDEWIASDMSSEAHLRIFGF